MTLPFLQENPTLTRELRTRMRGARAFSVLFVYLTLMAVALFVTYLVWWQEGRSNPGASFTVGRTFFTTLFLTQAILVAVITPSLTAGGLTIEKEQRTLEMLKASLLPRSSIAWGKLLAAVAFVGLLIVAALPLFSLSFLLGGVAPEEVLVSCGLLLTNAFVYGAIGLGCSAISRTTTNATILTYCVLTVAFFATLPFAALGLAGMVGPSIGARTGGMGLVGLNPLGAFSAAGGKDTYFGLTFPAWLISGGLNLLLGVIVTLAAGHRIEYPRSDRSGLLRVLTAVYVFLLAVGVFHFTLTGMRMLVGGMGGSAAAISALIALIVLVPIFATGDGLPVSGVAGAFFDVRRLWRGEAPSGLLFVLLLCVVSGGIFYLTNRFDAPQSKITVTQILRFTGLLCAVAWGFGAFALYLSAATRQRFSALGITVVVMGGLYLIPGTVAEWGDASAGTLARGAGFLSPLLAAAAIFDPANVKNAANLPWITTLLSLTTGLFFFASTAATNRKKPTP